MCAIFAKFSVSLGANVVGKLSDRPVLSARLTLIHHAIIQGGGHPRRQARGRHLQRQDPRPAQPRAAAHSHVPVRAALGPHALPEDKEPGDPVALRRDHRPDARRHRGHQPLRPGGHDGCEAGGPHTRCHACRCVPAGFLHLRGFMDHLQGGVDAAELRGRAAFAGTVPGAARA